MVTKASSRQRPRRRTDDKPATVAGYTPRVVVQFHDHVKLPYVDRAERAMQRLRLGPWKELVKRFPGITFRRLYTVLAPDKIRALIARATKMDHDYKPANLLAYFVVDAPPGVDPEVLAKALREWPIVKTAYFDPPGEEPAVDPTNDIRSPFQGYLDPAEDGIDAEFAWGFPGGDGAGIRVIDMERGWTLNHEDLAAHGTTAPLYGTNSDDSRAHGTAVLGEICARDNNLGCVGICPNVASMNVVSYFGSTRPNALLAAVNALSFGDVLLLEAQVDHRGWLDMPIEVLDAEFDTIRLATALGIVVVEAGGNGSNDLDNYEDEDGNLLFDRSFRDSGAILVGAATATAPHARLGDSNFGSRIDCYAWGEGVETCFSDPAGSTTAYTTNFTGTSAAAPIVTGAAIAVQGMASASRSARFSPGQLRFILSDEANGTLSDDPLFDRIGVMPDLKKIIDDVLELATDVYIRDFVGDTGAPHTGSIASSPDIILRPTAVMNPQAEFGEGSVNENSATLGFEAEVGQDNFIYVRVLNRGGSPATNVVATVYWSPPATLVTPDMWTLVGSVTIPTVLEGDVLTVSNAITWSATQIPVEGHYCFIGLVGTTSEPPPSPANFSNWNNFFSYIRENNNVTWRNFNVVDIVPPLSPAARDNDGVAGFVELPFLAPGAPDRGRKMRLEIVAKLPRGSRVVLEAPQPFAERMKDRAPEFKTDDKRGTVWLSCNPHGRSHFEEMLFPAKSRTRLRLLVKIPEEFRGHSYQIYARQVYRKQEVGRVTWRLVPHEVYEKRKSQYSEYPPITVKAAQ